MSFNRGIGGAGVGLALVLVLIPFMIPLAGIGMVVAAALINAILFIPSKVLGGKGTYREQLHMTAFALIPLAVLAALWISIPMPYALKSFVALTLALLGAAALGWTLKKCHGFSGARAMLVVAILIAATGGVASSLFHVTSESIQGALCEEMEQEEFYYIKKTPSFCNSLCDPGQRDICFNEYALKQNDLNGCFEINQKSIKYDCLSKYAEKTGNATICNLIDPADRFERYSCFEYVNRPG